MRSSCQSSCGCCFVRSRSARKSVSPSRSFNCSSRVPTSREHFLANTLIESNSYDASEVTTSSAVTQSRAFKPHNIPDRPSRKKINSTKCNKWRKEVGGSSATELIPSLILSFTTRTKFRDPSALFDSDCFICTTA